MSDDTRAAAVEHLRSRGFAVLRSHLPSELIHACHDGFAGPWDSFLAGSPSPNRGPHRHFVPMPFELPWFSERFFADPDILQIVRAVMDERVVADQWGCDVPLLGSEYQGAHVDYARPLFGEAPDLVLPPFALVVSFGLQPIGPDVGPLEIAPGTHAWPRSRAQAAIDGGDVGFEAVHLDVGDVLVRNPWTLHRGTPNRTPTPRFLVSVRYVRRWYADDSREVAPMPRTLWHTLSAHCRQVMRFPLI
jgi:ectoine hydroxylase-related dioxygenase (phytanoyl-CoA dioxygenase family)